MKILKILREEVNALSPHYSWIGDMTFTEEIEQRLIAAGFDLKKITYRDKDRNGNRIYAQKEHDAEDIETAFVGE